jgi:1,3,6,8-tetrahydroxynaphthalene synthase
MAVLCKPSVSAPEYVITMEETLEFAGKVHAGKSQLPLALRLIQNTGVRKRHVVQPLEKTLGHPGFEERNRIYELESKKRCPEVIEQALANACVTAARILEDLRKFLGVDSHMSNPAAASATYLQRDFAYPTRKLIT